jgi:hypothetical protein
MIHKIAELMISNKHFIAIALAALVIIAYAVPYGIDVEAKKGDNPGKHYGVVVGYGYGLLCDKHDAGKGPLPCKP